MRVASRKRNSHKRNAQRQGLSGNPQRRAEQLRQRRIAAGTESLSPEEAAQFRELAYRLAGGAHPEPWWAQTHERILARARELSWPSRLVDVETQVCGLVGDEFYERLNAPEGGGASGQWLRALAEKAGAALRADLAAGGDNWQQLWALVRALALMTPETRADADSEAVLRVRAEFPDIKDPHEIALAEAGRAARLLADRGLAAVSGDPAAAARPTGKPLIARDVYGSRILLAAPFGYEGEPDHWYAWDVDLCWLSVVVGAGAFGTAEDALREWCDAVGPAASGAALAPCPAGLPARLLRSCLAVGVFAEMLRGSEPRELIREYYRMRQRARVLAGAAGEVPALFGTDHVPDAFLDWYATRHGDVPAAVTEAVATILSEWGQYSPDGLSFYACSPHRIEMAARLIRDEYDADQAGPATGLLPEWAQWCAEQSGLDGDAAARSLAAAHAAAADAGGADGAGGGRGGDDEGPFRRQE